MQPSEVSTAQRIATWMPEAVVVGSCLTVVGLAVGAISAAPAAACVALCAAGALAANATSEPEPA